MNDLMINQHCKGAAVYRPHFNKRWDTGNANAGRFQLDEKGVHKMYTPTNGGTQELIFITEPDVYRLVFGSKLETAERFQDWVFSEVLPQIRRTGVYEVQAPTNAMTMYAEIFGLTQVLLCKWNAVLMFVLWIGTAKRV